MKPGTKARRASGRAKLVIEFASKDDLLDFVDGWNRTEAANCDEGKFREVAPYAVDAADGIGHAPSTYILRAVGQRPDFQRLVRSGKRDGHHEEESA